MATQVIKAINMVTRDTTANWNKYPRFIPKAGELIVYSDYKTKVVNNETVNVPGMKIGDGLAYLVDLPFLGGPGDDSGINVNELLTQLQSHVADTTIHVTTQEKTAWNSKISCSISGENLVLTNN